MSQARQRARPAAQAFTASRQTRAARNDYAESEAARLRFAAEYQAKYPKAVESPFATVRLRERATRGAGSRTKGCR